MVVPGTFIVGEALLPIAFILALVSFFVKGGRGLGLAGLLVAIVGIVLAVIVFFAFLDDGDAAHGPASTQTSRPVTTTPTPAIVPADGTREHPYAIGDAVTSGDWTVVINSHVPTANLAVADASPENPAPPAGSHYEALNYTVTRTGEGAGYAYSAQVSLRTGSGTLIDPDDIRVFLADAIRNTELASGASATGSAVYLVPDGQRVLIEVAFHPGDVFFVAP